ncbi:hypothetical protein [Yoonia sp.]|uniref:hypothetical protein n=1 Tax=Yoonia sp. TaxID=2212373 RepID=UPI003F6A6473
MKKYVMFFAVGTSVALVAGCDSVDDETPAGYTSFADIEVDADAMQALYTDANGNLITGITPATALEIPDTGNATYNGFVAGEVAGSRLIGELTVTTFFDPGLGSITSSATNFYHENDGAYTGTLNGTGVLDQTATVPQISTNLDGDLTNGGVVYDTSIALEGDIIANGSDPIGAVAGFADGSLDSGGSSETFTGVFAAER